MNQKLEDSSDISTYSALVPQEAKNEGRAAVLPLTLYHIIVC